MNQNLLLNCDNQKIGVVRNPYERAVTEYFYDLNYIGFDRWLIKHSPTLQTTLYHKCDYIVSFEDWKNELSNLDLHPKDTSILEGVKPIADWRRWYTMKSKTLVTKLYWDDIKTFGYRY